MAYKKFDKKLFEANDRKARDWTTQFLTSKGFKVREHPNKYAQDLIAVKDGDEWLVECELKHVWNDRYETLQLPERKKKFCNERTMFFVIISEDESFVFTNKTVLSSPLVEVRNTHGPTGEKFFQIPVDRCKRVMLP